MSRLKRLVHEVHHRSLWQVLAIFLGASWGVIQFVEFLTERAGLPDWTPSMALVFLLIGLPIVLGTAFVQEGMPGRDQGEGRKEDEADAPDEGVGMSPGASTDPQVIAAGPAEALSSASEPTGLQRWLTWRTAFLGGVGALALLGFLVAAYFVMWSTGIGPVGNLVAQGVIEEGDRVILATFADETDEGLGSVVTGALRVDLAQGSILNLVEDADLGPVLARMQVAPGTPLTAELGRDAAVREGIGAVLDGAVARAGTGYLITATFREAATGRSLAAFRVTADGPDDLIPAIDRLSREIRSKSGESLRSVRAGEPLEQVTTRSLEALRLFTEADGAFSEGDLVRARDLLEQAVAIDPEFAMAWRRMAAALNNIGTDWAAQEHAATQAYLHRDRLTDRERYLAEASYFSQVEQDRARTVAAYQNVLRIAPDDRAALNNLGNEYLQVEDHARAEEMYRRAVDGPGRTSNAFSNLIVTRIAAGDFAGAREAYGEFETAYPGNQQLPDYAFWVAFVNHELEQARALVLPQTEDPGLPAFARSDALVRLALISYREGRLDEGRGHMLAGERVAGEVGAEFQLVHRLWTAHAEEVLGDRSWALEHVQAPIDDGTFESIDPDARPWWFMGMMLAMLGDRERAEAVLEAWEAFLAERGETPIERRDIARIRLILAAQTGRTDGTLEAFADMSAEFGCPDCWADLRARIAAATGRTAEAIQLYERVAVTGHNWLYLTGTVRIQPLLVLGPLHEAAGDTARAVEAYRRLVSEWANADERGMERVRQAEARIAALSGGSSQEEQEP